MGTIDPQLVAACYVAKAVGAHGIGHQAGLQLMLLDSHESNIVLQEARNTAAASLAAKLAEHQKQWEQSRTDSDAAATANGLSSKPTPEDRIKHALRNCSPHMVSFRVTWGFILPCCWQSNADDALCP